jgi:hypothetical protein
MNEINKFIIAEKNAIEKSVYIDSEKEKRNLRLDNDNRPIEDYFIKWINMHAKQFREAWELSICKNCKNVYQCHDCLKELCNLFEE